MTVPSPTPRDEREQRLKMCLDDVRERPYSHPVATGWYAEDVAALLSELATAQEVVEAARGFLRDDVGHNRNWQYESSYVEALHNAIARFDASRSGDPA